MIIDVETDSDTHKQKDNTHLFKGRVTHVGMLSQNYYKMIPHVPYLDGQLVGHNLKFDAKMLLKSGTSFGHNQIYMDTCLAWRLINENAPADLHYIYKELTGCSAKHPYPEWDKKLAKYWGEDSYQAARERWIAEHNKEDCEMTQAVAPILMGRLKELNLWDWFLNVEMENVRIWTERELEGIPIDVPLLSTVLYKITEHHTKFTKKIQEECKDESLNVNSGDQLAKYLYQGRTPRKMTEGKTRGVIDDEEIAFWASKGVYLAVLLAIYRKWEGLRKYAQKLLDEQVEGKIYTTFNTYGTETGRYTSKRPNVQQIPGGKWIRKCFTGNLLIADYSQIEFRLLGHFSGEPKIINGYTEGKDFHDITAKNLGCSRHDAKTFNFKAIYSLDENFRRIYPKVKDMDFRIHEILRDRGYVRTIAGRRRRLPDYKQYYYQDRNWKKYELLREAFNSVIQGSMADIMKVAVCNVAKIKEVKIINIIHDELVMEVEDWGNPEILEKVRLAMLAIPWRLKIPLEVEIKYCKNWAEK